MAKRLKLFPWMLSLCVLSLAVSAWLTVRLYQDAGFNARLQTGVPQHSRSADALFADAYLLARRGDMQQSLALYAEALTNGTQDIRKASYFNSGNLYLTQANRLLDERGIEAFDQISPLLALARESYREALRLDPDWHEAKYNYELALRLSPLFELKRSNREPDDEPDEAESMDGWASIPGFPRGMP
ncbi:MAG TPA: hypothetical protein VIK69_03800 [Methylophilaceae bacterium]|jgi:mxaK protein